MTTKQADFIRSLATKRALPIDDGDEMIRGKARYVLNVISGNVPEPDPKTASSVIDWLLTLPLKAPRLTPQAAPTFEPRDEYKPDQGAYFTSLGEGKWGVTLRGRNVTARPGQWVMVSKRNGGTTRVVLGRQMDKWNGGRAATFAIAAREPNTQRRQTGVTSRPSRSMDTSLNQAAARVGSRIEDAKRDSLRCAQRAVREAQAAIDNYNPADFEYFDGETDIEAAHVMSLYDKRDEARRWLADVEREGNIR